MRVKRDIPVCKWNKTLGKAFEDSQYLIDINAYLDTVYGEILNVHRELHMERKLITAKLIKARYVGEDEIHKTLMELVEYYNTQMKFNLKPGTLKNYYSTKKYLVEFLRDKLKTDDVYLIHLKYKFIVDFEYYIRNYVPKKHRKTCSNNGTMKHLERLMKMVNLAVKLEWLEKDPFRNFKLRFEKYERSFLTQREIDLIENTTFKGIGYERVKDIFLFSCYTGLSFMDVKKLIKEKIVKGIDGNYWISTKRVKTNEPVKIPMLPKAVEIMDKYCDDPLKENKLLPVYSNQKCHLKQSFFGRSTFDLVNRTIV